MSDRISYRRIWCWLPFPHRELLGSFDPGEGGPMSEEESRQVAKDLEDPEHADLFRSTGPAMWWPERRKPVRR